MGNEEPDEEELRSLGRRVECFLRRHVSDDHAREDLVQETLLRVVRGIHRLRDRRALHGWACRIAFHLAIDRRRRPEDSAEGGGEFRDLLHDSLAAPADHQRDLEDRRRAWLRRLLRSLSTLAPQDRALVIGHYFVGHSCSEIARRTGLSVANVKVRMFRARQRMRADLPSAAQFASFLWERSRYEGGRVPPRRRPGRQQRA